MDAENTQMSDESASEASFTDSASEGQLEEAALVALNLASLAERVVVVRTKLRSLVDEYNDDDDVEELLRKLDLPEKTVTLLRTANGGLVFLIGTAHFSLESNADVRRVVQALLPDTVMLELCRSRQRMLHMSEESIRIEAEQQNMGTLRKNARHLGASTAIMQYLMVQLSNFIMKQVGMAPGGEFRAAFQEASSIPFCRVLLGDRDVGITLRRTMAMLGPWGKFKFFCSMLRDFGTITKEDIEQLKNMDLIEQLMHEMAGEYPELCQVLVDERDQYLARTLHEAGGTQQVPATVQLFREAVQANAAACCNISAATADHAGLSSSQLTKYLSFLLDASTSDSRRAALLEARHAVQRAAAVQDAVELRNAALLAASAVAVDEADGVSYGPSVVVGVVGMGHMAGVKRNWNQALDIDISVLCKVPEPSLLWRSMRLSVKLCAFGVLCYTTKRLVHWMVPSLPRLLRK